MQAETVFIDCEPAAKSSKTAFDCLDADSVAILDNLVAEYCAKQVSKSVTSHYDNANCNGDAK